MRKREGNMKHEFQEKFTPEALHALAFAEEEADHNHKTLGDEHILMGLMRARDGAAGKLLYRLGLEVEPTRAMIARLTAHKSQETEAPVALSNSARLILENALKEAELAEQDQVGTGLLLLALTQAEQGPALSALEHFGVTSRRLQSYKGELLHHRS